MKEINRQGNDIDCSTATGKSGVKFAFGCVNHICNEAGFDINVRRQNDNVPFSAPLRAAVSPLFNLDFPQSQPGRPKMSHIARHLTVTSLLLESYACHNTLLIFHRSPQASFPLNEGAH